MKKILLAIAAIPAICFAQSEPVILECERIGESKTTASLEIDLKEKKILFDAYDQRENWRRFNQLKLKKYQEAVDADDEVGKKLWAPTPYEPTNYAISSVTKSEVTAHHPFPIQGVLKVNRNTLIAYRRIAGPAGYDEASFKCNKVTKGF